MAMARNRTIRATQAQVGRSLLLLIALSPPQVEAHASDRPNGSTPRPFRNPLRGVTTGAGALWPYSIHHRSARGNREERFDGLGPRSVLAGVPRGNVPRETPGSWLGFPAGGLGRHPKIRFGHPPAVRSPLPGFSKTRDGIADRRNHQDPHHHLEPVCADGAGVLQQPGADRGLLPADERVPALGQHELQRRRTVSPRQRVPMLRNAGGKF